MFAQTVHRLKHDVSRCVQQSRPLLPRLGRKPRIIGHWLFNARNAQLFLLAILVLMPTLVPAVVDTLLDFIFPAETRERLFGLVTTSHQNPLRSGAGVVVYLLLSLACLSVLIYLLLQRLPDSIRQADDISRDKEREADRLAGHSAAESVLLYQDAIAWSSDPTRDVALQTKIARLSPLPEATSNSTANTGGTAIYTADNRGNFPTPPGDRYEISAQLGQGAMGIVYQARDRKLDREVALKQLAPALVQDPSLLARFRQEAKALARLSHGNIVQVYDFLEGDGQCWIVMELVTGRDLDRVLTEGPMKMADVRKLGRQMAQGLAYAHDKGVIHRDFKPANVILTEDNQVKITDFGIARIAGSSMHTQLNTVMGSPAYMSPEQANGDPVDHRTDIYALGITLFWMATGRLPFTGDASAVLAQHLGKKPPSLRKLKGTIPEAFEKKVLKMLAKKPDDRPKDMREVSGFL